MCLGTIWDFHVCVEYNILQNTSFNLQFLFKKKEKQMI